MDNLSFFSLFVIWYFTFYGPPQNVVFLLRNSYNKFCSITLQGTKLIEDDTSKEVKKEKTQIKYEDKYLKEIRKLNKEFEFTDEELISEEECYEILYNGSKELLQTQIEEIKCELLGDDNYGSKNELIKGSTISAGFLKKLDEMTQKLLSPELKESSKKKAKQHIINKRLEKIKDCYVMEKTPLGNVLMIYDMNKESFRYYSDSSIPYRYLESVGRKYVKTFGCRPIFVDMDEELKICEEKWENEKKAKELKDEEEQKKKEEAIKTNKPVEEKKKNIYAKFKSYNKEAQSGHVNTAPPPKNSIPNRKLTESQENEKILLKEKANRYTYEGKMINFSFLKKVERKEVDKKFSTTYADFKRMAQLKR